MCIFGKSTDSFTISPKSCAEMPFIWIFITFACWTSSNIRRKNRSKMHAQGIDRGGKEEGMQDYLCRRCFTLSVPAGKSLLEYFHPMTNDEYDAFVTVTMFTVFDFNKTYFTTFTALTNNHVHPNFVGSTVQFIPIIFHHLYDT
jgi:hypothetical protein